MLASKDGYLSLRANTESANTESGQAAGHVLSQHDSNFQNRRLITWWISVYSQNVLKSSDSWSFLSNFQGLRGLRLA